MKRFGFSVALVTLGLTVLCTLLLASPLVAEPPQKAFGFNGTVSGFPTGEVFVSGGGAFSLATNFVHSGGGFSCLLDVLQGPLSVSINEDDPGPCLQGEGVRWDTAGLLPSTGFTCTGADAPKTAVTSDTTVVLQADFYRAGDGIEESFTAKMIVSATEIAPKDFPGRISGYRAWGVAQRSCISRTSISRPRPLGWVAPLAPFIRMWIQNRPLASGCPGVTIFAAWGKQAS